MKILRIKFQNLNSLPVGDVDLENGPLARAGIFAITGPTGAGKSTILDAVTLALYGRAARYGNAPNPEDMMSRHAGECQAEVLFEVPRGKFVARWELRRARGKPTGKVQPAKRSIMDEQGAVLAERVGDADRLIEELTGLDCGRFLRSVLLAQGEFAQFLKADKDARAALLESLTGTKIYSELSVAAFQEFTNREQALVQAGEALGRIVLLTDEERSEKSAEAERLHAKVVELNQERDTIVLCLQQGQRLAEWLAAATELDRDQVALEQAAAEASPEFGRLARHRLSEAFGPYLQTLDNLLAQAASQEIAYKEAVAGADAARGSLDGALQAASSLGEELVASAEVSLSHERTEVKRVSKNLAELDGWLASHAADKELNAVFPGLVERLVYLSNDRSQREVAVADCKKLAAERSKATECLGLLEESLNAVLKLESEAALAAAQCCDSLAALLGGRTSEQIAADLFAIEQRRSTLEELRLSMEKRDAVVAQGLQIANEQNALTEQLEGARAQKTATIHEAETQAEILEAARKSLELLERIADHEDQRAQLVTGQPCPLCGALKHPFAQPEAQPSAGIQEAKRHLAVAQAANATAAKEAQIATAFLARTEEALNQVTARHGKGREEQMAAHQAFAGKAEALRIFTAEALGEAIAASVKAREDHHALTSAIRTVEARKNATQLAHAGRHGKVEIGRQKLAGQQSALLRLDAQLAENAAVCERTQAATDAVVADLTALMRPFAVELPEPGAESETRKILESRCNDWVARASEQASLDAELKQAAIRIEESERRVVELRRRKARLAVDLPIHFDPAQAAQFREKWNSLDDAEAGLDTLRTLSAQTAAGASERCKNLEEVQNAVKSQAAELDKRLEGSAFADAGALRAARLKEDEARVIGERKASVDEKRQALVERLRLVCEQIRLLRDARAPEGAAVEDASRLRGELDKQITDATENRTTLRNDLARDEQTRREKKGQAEALFEQRKRLETWEQLKQLIGSHDGAKFRQFAQGLSLDVLIRHANRHLRRLSDRYEVRRAPGGELTLEIVDLYQANVTRPMASLSGGESFLVSLALALGLSDLAGRNVRIDSLFIDEGFGSLDAETLDTAVAALDILRLSNKTVGVISHVELLKERIPVQLRVEKLPGGMSVLKVEG